MADVIQKLQAVLYGVAQTRDVIREVPGVVSNKSESILLTSQKSKSRSRSLARTLKGLPKK